MRRLTRLAADRCAAIATLCDTEIASDCFLLLAIKKDAVPFRELTVLSLAISTESDAGIVLELLRFLHCFGLSLSSSFGRLCSLSRLCSLRRCGPFGRLGPLSRFGSLGSIRGRSLASRLSLPEPGAGTLPLSFLRGFIGLCSLTRVRSESLLSLSSFTGVSSRAAFTLLLSTTGSSPSTRTSLLSLATSSLTRRSGSLTSISSAVVLLLAVCRVQESVQRAVAGPSVVALAPSGPDVAASEVDAADGQAGVVVGGPVTGDIGAGLTCRGLAVAVAFAFATELETSGAADADAAVFETDLSLFDSGLLDFLSYEDRGAAGDATLW